MRTIGYDMYWVIKPEGEDEAVAAARAVAKARSEELEPLRQEDMDGYLAQMESLWDDVDKANASYFRLNIWGMGVARRVMDAAGMLCSPEEIASEDWKALPPYDDDDPDGEGGKAYREASDKLLAEHRGECPGIPDYKLCSNDGWIITPAEIHAALRRKNMDAVALAGVEVPGWWGEWVQWLIDAADHEGFRVY